MGRPRTTDLRDVVNAIQYIAATGCQWSLLPRDFPPFTTVQRYFYDWRNGGLLRAINHLMVMAARELEGRETIAVSVFVKNPEAEEHGRIIFHDIGDYLGQKQKLAIIRDFGAVGGIRKADGWERITPNDQNDWLNQRDASFDAFMKIGDKKSNDEPSLFESYSLGVVTNQDAWCFNSSQAALQDNISGLVGVYEAERECLHRENAWDKAKRCE